MNWHDGMKGHPKIKVPWFTGPSCQRRAPWGRPMSRWNYVCTRNPGHTGRHMAHAVTGRVMAVWQ